MGSADFRLVRPVAVAGDVAFSRASPATYWDRTGRLQTAAANALRWSYDPSDMSKAPAALLEPAATNLFSYSNDLSQAAWSKSNLAGVGTKTYSGPSGDNSAWYVVEDATNGVHELRTPSITLTAGTTYTQTVFAKAGARQFVRSGFSSVFNPAASTSYAVFDLVNGTVGYTTGSVITASIQAVGNGWYRCSTTMTVTASVSGTNYVGAQPAAYAPSHQGDGASGIYLACFQLEVGSSPTSYVPADTGAPATRAVDVIAAGVGLVGSNVPIAESPYSGSATFAKDAVVYDPATYLTYQSLIAGNTGKLLTDTTAWFPLKKAVNRWLMFDKVVNSQTSVAEEVTVLIQPGELVNTLGLLNVSGSSVTVSQTGSGYSQTKSLVRHDVLSWYDWFYEEPIREGDVIFDDIPPYASSALSISVINPGDQAAIGCCVVGKARTIGQTAWDFSGGILSYSTSSTDTFGNVTMVKRDNSKVLNFEVYVPKGYESEAYRLLSKEYTDIEIMVIGAEDYSMTYAYGFLGQWSVPVSAGGEKTSHIEFKGLV